MRKNIQDLLLSIIKNSLSDLDLDKFYPGGLFLDLPSDPRFGDLSTNIAMQLARATKKSPHEVALNLLANIKGDERR